MSEPDDSAVPAVIARGIRMRGPWGPVYGPVDLEIEDGGLTVLVCPAGSGRTALLMTLAGRMAPVSGELTVFGRRRPARSSTTRRWRVSTIWTPYRSR